MSPKKDYSDKNFSGPPVAQYERKQEKFRKRILIGFMAAVVVYLCIYIIGYSPLFRITEINIIGTKNIENVELEKFVIEYLNKRRFVIFRQHNILLLKSSALISALSSQFSVNNVSLTKKFLHTINITVEETIPVIVWINERGGYYIDPQGIVTSKVSAEQFEIVEINPQTNILRHKIITQNIASIYDENNNPVTLYRAVTSQKTFELLINILEEINRRLRVGIDYYSVNIEQRNITAVTSEGWKIIFHLDNDPLEQIENVNLLLKETITNRNNLEYIDVRFNERVFYK